MSVPIVGIDTDIYFVGDTKRFRTFDSVNNIGATKDGALWSGITSAQLFFVKPDGTTLPAIAGVQEAAGIWHADSTALTFDVLGEWHRYWKLSDGTTTLTWGRMVFTVRSVS